MKKTISFYGTESCVNSWFKIMKRENFEIVNEPAIETEGGVSRSFLTVKISANDVDYLQSEYWYAKETKTASPWNWRIGFKEI